MNAFSLSGEIALVTGGGQNFGSEIAYAHNLVLDGGFTEIK